MSAIVAYRSGLAALWLIFIAVWVVGAFSAKKSAGGAGSWWREAGFRFVIIALVLMIFRIPIVRQGLHDRVHLRVDDPRLVLTGLIVCALGIALAIWARVYLGSNWGLPMSRKAEPELVTTGPYAYVRHPMYTGLLLALLGSGLAETTIWLIPVLVGGTYFIYSALTEERIMAEMFPDTYPAYRRHTKMLIPFVL